MNLIVPLSKCEYHKKIYGKNISKVQNEIYLDQGLNQN